MYVFQLGSIKIHWAPFMGFSALEVCMGFQEPRWEVPAFVRAQQAYKAQAYAVQKSLVRKLNG